jgi:hypothetical protein
LLPNIHPVKPEALRSIPAQAFSIWRETVGSRLRVFRMGMISSHPTYGHERSLQIRSRANSLYQRRPLAALGPRPMSGGPFRGRLARLCSATSTTRPRLNSSRRVGWRLRRRNLICRRIPFKQTSVFCSARQAGIGAMLKFRLRIATERSVFGRSLRRCGRRRCNGSAEALRRICQPFPIGLRTQRGR